MLSVSNPVTQLTDLSSQLYRQGGIVEIYGKESSGKTLLALQLASQLTDPRFPAPSICDASFSLGSPQLAWTGKQPFLSLEPEHPSALLHRIATQCESGEQRIFVIDPLPALPLKDEDAEFALARELTQAFRNHLFTFYRHRAVIILANHEHFFSPDNVVFHPFTPGGKCFQQITALRLECLGCRVSYPKGVLKGRVKRNTLSQHSGIFSLELTAH